MNTSDREKEVAELDGDFDEKGRRESRRRKGRVGGHKRSFHRASRGSREAEDGKDWWKRGVRVGFVGHVSPGCRGAGGGGGLRCLAVVRRRGRRRRRMRPEKRSKSNPVVLFLTQTQTAP